MTSLDLFAQDADPMGLEHELWQNGLIHVAGVDEAGRGALAGPVVAAAVVMDESAIVLVHQVKDSKQLNAQERERLFPVIKRYALATGVGIVSPKEIDQHNILVATLRAMQLAIEDLRVVPQMCLVDGNVKIPIPCPQLTIVKGDARVFSIAAASIVAKVTRDHMMQEIHHSHPAYDFAQNKGYGTKAHMEALVQRGPCMHHRRSFSLPQKRW